MSGTWVRGENGVLLNSGRKLTFPDRNGVLQVRRGSFIENDCWNISGSFPPFISGAISSGTVLASNNAQTAAGRPGVVRARSSTTANSGFWVGQNGQSLIYQGLDEFFVIFCTPSSFTGTTIRIGFANAAVLAAPTYGNFLNIDSAGVALGRNVNNSVTTDAVPTATLALTTWYQALVTISADRLSARYRIRNSPDNGVSVYDQTVTGNMPGTTATAAVSPHIIGLNSGIVAVDLWQLDYLSLDMGDPVR